MNNLFSKFLFGSSSKEVLCKGGCNPAQKATVQCSLCKASYCNECNKTIHAIPAFQFHLAKNGAITRIHGASSEADYVPACKSEQISSNSFASVLQQNSAVIADDSDSAKKTITQFRQEKPFETDLFLAKVDSIEKRCKIVMDRDEMLNDHLNEQYMLSKLFSPKNMQKYKTLNNELKLKFIVSDIELWKSFPRVLRFVVSALVDQSFGFVHTALQVRSRCVVTIIG